MSSQAAIVKGAVLRGLEGIRPVSVIAKRHYGWAWGEEFRPGIDKEADSYIDSFTDRKMCRGRMHWVVRKVWHERLVTHAPRQRC
jgi:hypothetical protein